MSIIFQILESGEYDSINELIVYIVRLILCPIVFNLLNGTNWKHTTNLIRFDLAFKPINKYVIKRAR